MGGSDEEISINGQEWTQEIDMILCRIGDCSKCMAKLCTYVSEYHQSQRAYLLIPAAVFSWGLTIFGMFATYYGKEKLPDSKVILVNSLINFVIATFTTVAEKSQAGTKVELFQQLARDFYNLSGTITMELSKQPCNRIPVSTFLANTNTRYKDLENSVPPLSQALIIEFIKSVRKEEYWRQMHKPNIMSELSPTEASRLIWKDDREGIEAFNPDPFIRKDKEERDNKLILKMQEEMDLQGEGDISRV
jgi:hypothetical protein